MGFLGAAAGALLGIAVQLLILLPFLTKAGVVVRPRFDFRGTGLGHTLRLGGWTVLFVVVNQIAYTVVVNLASSGPAEAVGRAGEQAATGYTVYSFAFLIVMVPHSIITVSLATAVLPRLSALAADDDRARLADTLMVALRSALSVVVPFAADQFFWAHRLHALRIAPQPVAYRDVTGSALRARIDAASDMAMRERAAAVGESMAHEAGVANAIAHIATLFGRRRVVA